MILVLTTVTLALVIGLALLFYSKISLGLAVFIFSLPFERIGSYPLNPATGYPLLHPAQIVGAALIGAYILRWLTGKEKPKPIQSLPFLGVFLLTSLISA